MRIVKEGEGANLIEIGQVVKDGRPVSREFLVFDGGKSYVLATGTPEYVADLKALDPEFSHELVLVLPSLESPAVEQSIEQASELPSFGQLLIEQLPE